MKPEIEVFLMNDQPVTCPKCGSRTDFEEVIQSNNTSPIQIHQCLERVCQFKFQVEES